MEKGPADKSSESAGKLSGQLRRLATARMKASQAPFGPLGMFGDSIESECESQGKHIDFPIHERCEKSFQFSALRERAS